MLTEVARQFATVIRNAVGATLSTESTDAVEFLGEEPCVRLRFTKRQHAEQADTQLGWRVTSQYLHVSVSLGVSVITPYNDALDEVLAPLIAEYGGGIGSIEVEQFCEVGSTETSLRVSLSSTLVDPSPHELQAALRLLQLEAPRVWQALQSEELDPLPATQPAPVLHEWLRGALPRHFERVTEQAEGTFVITQRQRDGEWIAHVRAELRDAVPVLTIRVPLITQAMPHGADPAGNRISLADYVARYGSYTLGHLVVSPFLPGTFTVHLEQASPVITLAEVQLVAQIKSMIATVNDLIPTFRGFGGIPNVYDPDTAARRAFLNTFRFVAPHWVTRVRFDTVYVLCGEALDYTDAAFWITHRGSPEQLADWTHEYRKAFRSVQEIGDVEIFAVQDATPFQALAQFAHSRGITGTFSALL